MDYQPPSLEFCCHPVCKEYRSLLLCGCLLLTPLLLSGMGCAHRQLERNTALAATTVNNIQYRMVLDNIAMLSCEPANLPSHVRLADGTVQISNRAGFGEASGFSLLGSSQFAFDRFGPAASTNISEQWGTDAVEDPIQVFALQSIYRKAFGLEPLEEPNFITAGKRSRMEQASYSNPNGSGDKEGKAEASHTASGNDDRDWSESERSHRGELPQPEGQLVDNWDSNLDAKQNSREDIPANLDAADFDVPMGWFSVGCKKDVPKNACYVGSYRDRYA